MYISLRNEQFVSYKIRRQTSEDNLYSQPPFTLLTTVLKIRILSTFYQSKLQELNSAVIRP